MDNTALNKYSADSQKRAALKALCDIAKNIAEYAMASGITAPELNRIVDRSFVESAHKLLDKMGELNYGRIALKTGIERKRVGKIVSAIDCGDDDHLAIRNGVAKNILTAWHYCPEFQNADGEPLPLPKSGSGVSFSDLARQHGRDIHPATIVQEMIEHDAITELDGFLYPVRRDFVPRRANVNLLSIGSGSIADLIKTVHYNTHLAQNEDSRLYQRRATANVPERYVSELKAFVANKVDECLTIIDEEITSKSAELAEGESSQRVGVGVFQIKGE